METKRTIKEKTSKTTDSHRLLFTKGFLAIFMLTSLSILSGCQDQMTSLKTQDFEYTAIAEETNPEPIPAQLASKIVLKSKHEEEISTASSKNIESHIPDVILAAKYKNMLILGSNQNKQSWKEAYDGIGVPLVKISF